MVKRGILGLYLYRPFSEVTLAGAPPYWMLSEWRGEALLEVAHLFTAKELLDAGHVRLWHFCDIRSPRCLVRSPLRSGHPRITDPAA